MKETLLSIFFLGFVCFQTVSGQVDTFPRVDSIASFTNKVLSADTIPTNSDVNISKNALDEKVKFGAKDSSILNIAENRMPSADTIPSDSDVNISENALDKKVEFGAKDSSILNVVENKMHLYGDAFVKYEGLELKAGYIVVDLDSNIAVAQTFLDSIGAVAGKPSFTDGAQNFEAEKMRYNFKSKKGLVFGVSTTQSNLFLTGTKTKFVSRDIIEKDSTITQNILYNKRAIFSTCNLPHPHYGIRSGKQKVVADKVVVAGPSNLEISGIPLPVVLPFAVFPLKQFKSTGLIFPEGYEYSPQWGFGLEGVGWYFPINDYIDLRMTGDIYFHGTWGLRANSNYRKRYKYNGTFDLAYSSRKSVDEEARTKSYSIRWSHSQDAKAHPTRRLTGNVNIQGNGYQRVNNNDAQSVLQNTLSSNVSYSQSFPGKPFRLSATMSHSQNTQSRAVNLSLPTVNFQMDRVYPFKKKGGSASQEQWYEKVSFRYNAQAQNKFTATDTTLFSQQTLDNARFGLRHEMSTDLNFNLLKYINVSPNASLREVWNFHTIRRNFDPTAVEAEFDSIENVIDTTVYGAILTDTLFGPEPFRQLSTGVSFNTILYGTMQFKKGRLKGIRHMIKPSLSFNYIPDYSKSEGFFRSGVDSTDTDSRADFNSRRAYNIFQGGVYGTPSTSKKQMLMSYSLNNIFEAKYYSKQDSIDKKIKIFDNIRVNGNYNFAADSLNFSTVAVGGTTRLLKGMTTFSANATWDPYAVNANNRRINTFYLDSNKKLLRFVRADFRLNTRMSISTLKKLFEKEKATPTRRSATNNSNQRGPNGPSVQQQPDDGFLKFLEGFNLNHSLVFNATADADGKATWDVRTHSLNVTIRQIQLTENWGVGVGNIGYDFKNKRTTYPDFRITRDLHCWEAFFAWQPQRGTYFFTIKVKNAPLDALKIPYRKNNADAFGGF